MTNFSPIASGSTDALANVENASALSPNDAAKVEERFGDQYEPRMRQAYDVVRTLSAKGEAIVSEVVHSHSRPLDTFVDNVDAMLEDIRNHGAKFSDEELHRLTIRLPVLMYRLTDIIGKAGLESDVAKAITKNLQAVHYLRSTAKTIPAKRAHAELLTAENEDAVELAKHVHQRLKAKMDTADKLFDGIRKVLTSRDGDKAVFGRESRGPIPKARV